MFTMIAGISQFERDLISGRTKEGLKSARAIGRIGGRKRLISARIEQAIELYDKKIYSLKEIEERTGICKSTLYRRLDERKGKLK